MQEKEEKNQRGSKFSRRDVQSRRPTRRVIGGTRLIARPRLADAAIVLEENLFPKNTLFYSDGEVILYFFAGCDAQPRTKIDTLFRMDYSIAISMRSSNEDCSCCFLRKLHPSFAFLHQTVQHEHATAQKQEIAQYPPAIYPG